jgi:uncharacterized protein (DUF2164 family)
MEAMPFMPRKKDESERIFLTKEQREAMTESLMRYFREERDDAEFGHLAAELLLRHVLREIAPDIYNAGVRDAARFLSQRIDDIGEIEIYPNTAR